MAKNLGLSSNTAAACNRKSPRFKFQSTNQSISNSHREKKLGLRSKATATPLRRSSRFRAQNPNQSDLGLAPSVINSKQKASRTKTRLGDKQICPPLVCENVCGKDAALGFVNNRRSSPRLAKTVTTSMPQDGSCDLKKIDCMVTKLGFKQTRPSDVCENASQKDAVLGSDTTSTAHDESTAQSNCDFSLESRRSPRLASVGTNSNNFHCKVTKNSTRSRKSNKKDSSRKIGGFRPSPTLRNNSAEKSCTREPDENCSKGTRKSHRLAALSIKLEETNCSEVGTSQRRLPTICENASGKAAIMASKPLIPPNQRRSRRSKRIVNQSDGITRKDTKYKYVEESDSEPDSDYEYGESPVGKKRRRDESAETDPPVEYRTGERGGLDEWTEEQEMALRKAYLLAMPSPHFWKKVSKMVPGKNAQECFDRIQSNFATPPSNPPKTRLNKASQMDSPFRKFDLLDPNSPKNQNCAEQKTRKVSKQKKTRDARKTVRHLLKKQQLVDQVQEADYFSQFEASPVVLPSDVKLPSDKERENSLLEKNLKPGPSEKQPDPSPAVLKRVKNMELHEKYIDHLHCVDAKRKACVRRCANNKGTEVDRGTQAGELKGAKTALVSEAQDFIGRYKQLQGDPFGDCAPSDDEEDDDYVV